MILAAVPLCDRKHYAWPVALNAIARQDYGPEHVVLFVDVQTENPSFFQSMTDWLREHRERFAGVVTDWWWDTRDVAPADTGLGTRIRPITFAREKARAYALNRVLYKGWLETSLPKPGMAGVAWYSPVTDTDGGEFTHVWYVDADVEPPPNALRLLLGLNVPMASGVFYGRPGTGSAGRIPYAFTKERPGLGYGVHTVGSVHGVMQVDFTGAGCFLVREDVLRRISWRHWKTTLDETYWSEDAYFAFDAGRNGFGKVHVHGDVQCRHFDPSGAVV